MTQRHSGPGWTARLVLALGFALAAWGFSAPAASAHASLVSTDPVEGAVVPQPPEVVTLTFDEPVSLSSASTRLYDAAGAEVSADAQSIDKAVMVSPGDRLGEGTYVLSYRVISADSHPISGSLTFSVGAPSEKVTAPPSADVVGGDPGVRTLHGVLQGLFYATLFLAGGLVVFTSTLLPVAPVLDRVRGRLRALSLTAASVAVAAAMLLVPVGVLYQDGLGLGDLATARPWQGWTSPGGAVAVVVALGLTVGHLAARASHRFPRITALTAVAASLAAVALVGHTRSFGPPTLVIASDVVHVLAAAVWFGGLVGLAVSLPALAKRETLAAQVLVRFSTVAGGLLAAVAAAGLLLGWRILGSWSALTNTTYGLVLIAKVVLVALVVGVAAWNRYRLLPDVVRSAGYQARTTAARRFSTAVRVEAFGLVAALGLTGFLVNQVPTPGEPTASESTTVTATGDDVRVVAHLEPGAIGSNTLFVQVQTVSGEPVEPYAAPVVALSSERTDLGSRPTGSIDAGTYRATVVIPSPGKWQVQVSVRTDEFTNPVLSLPVTVEG